MDNFTVSCEGVHEWNKDKLNSLHTKQLLKLRHGGATELIYNDFSGWCGELCPNGKKCLNIMATNRSLVLEILSTREHIPNKQEAKALRRQHNVKRRKSNGRK